MQLLHNHRHHHPEERDGGGGDNRAKSSSTAVTATTQEVLTHLFEDRELLRCDDDSMSIDQCETIREMEDRSFETSTPASVPVTTVTAPETTAMVVSPVSVGGLGQVSSIDGDGARLFGAEERSEPVKKKRGRPPKLASAAGAEQKKKASTAVAAPPVAVEEEEDVCFICFDGGNLVLCDRRGCPKAYHPSCIKRDESFFKSRAKWNCGWHICSTCQKSAYYMCYTCTYSVCKNCTRTADYVCIRGTKGLCGTCMKTVMLIEKVPQANGETVQVDFDDKTSWEYLFKVYWTLLKEKLALTLDELIQAKNPWQDPAMGFHRGTSPGEVYNGNGENGYGLNSFGKHVAANNIRGRKTKKQREIVNEDMKHPDIISKDAHIGHANWAAMEASRGQDTEWASKELQEFVAHMRNGDKNVLSQFDVQALLLEYIKRNNLRDPCRKCQILCDARLFSLFDKAIVGHFEMLKLLESHFPVKENSQVDGPIQGVINEAVPNQMGSNDMAFSDKRRKSRKRGNDRVRQLNPDEFAAIDAHNIRLIYLQRDMMEKMIDDPQRFHEKVVGSIVRIRVGGDDLKQDMYRLVQITGTVKVTEPYKVGDRSTDFKLEVLNLDKKEVVPMNEISNQDFSEDECRQLHQTFKSGLVKQLTMGEIQQKALVLQEGRVNNWLETEILRLTHLRDRASEKGQRKELRECVEKLQLLNSPEERQRRLRELPEVHADSSMDTSYKPEDAPVSINQMKQEGSLTVNYSKRKTRASISSETVSDDGNAPGKRPRRKRVFAAEKPVVLGLRHIGSIVSGELNEINQSSRNHGKEAHGISSRQTGVNASNIIGLASVTQSNQTSVKHDPCATSEVSPSPLSTGVEQSVSDMEIYKIWHYQDPTRKVQGPFTMAQLRKWSTSGHFPPDLRIWRIDEKQEDSVLLTDALNGQYNKELPFLSPEISVPFDGGNTKQESAKNNVTGTSKDLIPAEESCNPKENDNLPNKAAIEAIAAGALSSDSPHQTGQATSEVAATGALISNSPHQTGQAPGEVAATGALISNSPHQSSNSPHQTGQATSEVAATVALISNSPHQSSNSPHQTGQATAEVAATGALSSNSPHQTGPDDDVSLDEVKAVNVSQCPNSLDVTDPLIEPKACSNLNHKAVGESKQDEISPQSNEDHELGQNNRHQSPELSNKGHDICQNNGHESVDQSSLDQKKDEQSSEKQVDGEGGFTQLSGQNWKTQAPPISSSNGWDSHPTVVSLDDPVATSRPCKEIDLLGLFSPAPKPSNEVKNNAGDDRCADAKIPFQDMGPSWSTSSSLLAGAPQVNEVPSSQWGGYSAAPTKPVDDWDSSLMSASSLKPTEMINEHEATPNSGAGQLPQSSQTHPVLELSWQAIVNENDFSSLAEESVSDLLAEVEAMESLNGLPSPTSALKRAEDLAEGSKDDCFSPVEGFCPAPDPGKSDALSSTIDFLTLSQSAITDVSHGKSKDLGDASRISHGHSSSNVEMEIDGKHSDASVNQWKPGTNSEVQHPTPSTASWDPTTAPTWREGSMTDNTWGTVQVGVNMGWYSNTNTDWESRQRSGHGNGNLGRPPSLGNAGYWGNQPRYGGSKYSNQRDHSSPRDRAYQGTDLGTPRGRSGWNRQFSSGGTGSNSRQAPKGQRVCKFYESGYCKRGASCSYLHP